MKLVENNGRWYIHHNGAVIAVKAVQTMLKHVPNRVVIAKVLYEQHDGISVFDAHDVVNFVIMAKQLAAL
jgi:hypothetical protein